MKTKISLKYKIFAVIFFIQLTVISIFIYAFVKSFKEAKLTSAYEANANALSQIKSSVDSKIALLMEKIRSTTDLLEKNQLNSSGVLESLSQHNDKAVAGIYHYEVRSESPDLLQKIQHTDKAQFPDMTAYLSQLYKSSQAQFPFFWNFDWKGKAYTGLGFSLNYNLVINEQQSSKKHVFFFFFNKSELFSLRSANSISDIIVYNKLGQVLFAEGSMSAEGLSQFSKSSVFTTAVQNKNILQVSEQKINGQKFLVSVQAQPLGELVIATMISTEAAFQGVSQVYFDAAYLSVFSVLFSYLLATVLSSTITSPLMLLTKQMQNISKGQLDVEVEIKSHDEIGVLASNFKQMTLDLKASKADLQDLNRDLEQKVADRTKELEELTIKDPLTGAFNRRYYDQRVTEEIARSKRTGNPVGLLYLDIDHFKKYNDQNGHPEGDQLLINFVKVLKSAIRNSDYLCRLGGEEFCVITVDTPSEGVQLFAEKVRLAIYETDFKYGERQPMGRLSASIGVSLYPQFCSDPATLMKSADEALYKAKQGGRNQWVLAEKPMSSAVDEIIVDIHNGKKVS
ncbi:MAG: diguanylate cyclase [Bdellovibrio sp.]|nr:diguanylate cyclase [Bdellovibrio sp.]